MRSRIGAAKEFAGRAKEKFGKYVKAVVIIGSYATGSFVAGSDTDILVLIDDTQSDSPIDEKLRQTLHEKLQGEASKINKELHVQLHLLTEFWDYLRHGDTLFFNWLRTGLPVYDAGFFKPMKRLLLTGAIKPSKESISKNIDGAKAYLRKISSYMEWSVERLYRAITWSANAYLMAAGMPPAQVSELAPVFTKYFVEKGDLDKKHIETLDKIIKLQKEVEHGEKKHITPEQVAQLKKEAEGFVNAMEKGVKEFVSGKAKARELKTIIKTTPKIFWVYKNKDSRGYCWLFEDSIFVAVYENKKLKSVLNAPIKDGKLQSFASSDSKTLFKKMETSDFKPLVTPSLIRTILKKMPEEGKAPLEKVGVEYPGRALVDLTSVIVPKEEKKEEKPKEEKKDDTPKPDEKPL